MSAPTIHSARLALIPFSGADADEVWPCITPTLARYMEWEPAPSLAAFRDVWQAWLPAMDDGSDFIFTIRRTSDGQFLGLAGLHHADTPAPEFGIWIREDAHGHGYGMEAVLAVKDWAMAALQPPRFIYPVAEENWASRRIPEAMGGVVVDSQPAPKYVRLIYEVPAR
ncbi:MULTISPECIES: GNAT family N-acetyltransferase [Cupriavidus]|uniref:N-acetyltransferase n=1 Tax=Cupriavidus oxalaticus TaxID=96344 RepID=A0A4P7LE80_9BURK|nr:MULTISPECIES: GNAT family N-acetyltransferase [Cupriavidus]QBY54300.1 N-acetyltransferase [Cupriavidus oxalaticus]TDF67993.1 N-acetyltransferase [Cupriavidus sp. L7L]